MIKPEEQKETIDIEQGNISTLVIEFDQRTGQVRATGPIHNKGLCYMMLETARDIVKDQTDRDARGASPIVKPVLGGQFKI
jgi:hypothetical protein